MALRLGWSPEAIEDIEAIASYIERDSPWYAKAVAIVPEIGKPSIRERFVYSYRIIYRIETEQILVAAVIHGRRLLQSFLQRIEGEQKSNL